MIAPHRCPVCEGRGTVSREFYEMPATKLDFTTLPNQTTIERETCRSCNGMGIVWPPHAYLVSREIRPVPTIEDTVETHE
jgi:hypothetical protein